MLEQSWEAHATALANSPTSESLAADFQSIADQTRVSMHHPASIVFARDTRPSGVELTDALKAGLAAFGDIKIVDLGITTTPVLHYVVSATNDRTGLVGEPTIEGYLGKLVKAFNNAVVSDRTLDGIIADKQKKQEPLPKLYVDCANGVGINALSAFTKLLGDRLPIEALNTNVDDPAVLNSQCGADYVKTKQALPPSVEAAGYLQQPGTRGCSFDGDADRIVYYYLKNGKQFRLLDGDKIAVLVTMFLGDLVERLQMKEDDKIKVGVVQTAYANGSSSKYLRNVSPFPPYVTYLLTVSEESRSAASPPVSSTSITQHDISTLESTSKPMGTEPSFSLKTAWHESETSTQPLQTPPTPPNNS
jgi:phosphoacetylglucosamine mutase